MEYYGIDVFVAHDDIEGSSQWLDKLHDELKNCAVFMSLLTENYHRAEYTEQESGIAYWLKKKFLPISLDKRIPFGGVVQI